MSDLSGILMIVAFCAVLAIFAAIGVIISERLKLNETLSIWIWSARYGIKTRLSDWVEVYNGNLTEDEIIELAGWNYYHCMDEKGNWKDKRLAFKYYTMHKEAVRIGLHGISPDENGVIIASKELTNNE